MARCMAGLLIAAVCLSAGGAEPGPNTDEKTLKPQEMQSKTKDAGGSVDFIFEEERPFQQCHASYITQTPNGDLLACWFAGTEEKNPDVGIWMARYADGVWGKPYRVAKLDDTAHWNPVLFTSPEGEVWLFFKTGPEIPWWQTYVMVSKDNGESWSEAKELVEGDKGGRGPVRNKPIVLADGTWLAPASTEEGLWDPFIDRSEDQGKTWVRTENIAIDRAVVKGKGAIQPALWESKPGHVHALLRTTDGFVGRSDSTDGGKTWSQMSDSGLPNNNSGLDALLMEDGRLYLVYNPVSENWGPRSPLNLAVSRDNGQTWHDVAELENEEGEFSYPAIVRTKQGIAITYTWRRDRVRCWQIPDSLLRGL